MFRDEEARPTPTSAPVSGRPSEHDTLLVVRTREEEIGSERSERRSEVEAE
jgi:hypothetical protein